jgi:hypothetical protein
MRYFKVAAMSVSPKIGNRQCAPKAPASGEPAEKRRSVQVMRSSDAAAPVGLPAIAPHLMIVSRWER